ncbi:MAG: hypothetical protein ABSE58_07460 [Candidatus Limnocylindrales bacterium]|jgi:hypothetical protein
MPIGAEAYRRVEPDAELSCGDIAYLTLARTRELGEAPPGNAYDPVGRVPAYPMPATLALAHGREVAVDTMFGLVVTHSCEIDRQKNRGADEGHWDCRLTVAPIVPEPRVRIRGDTATETADWDAIAANVPVASLYLPGVADLSAMDPELPAMPWPRAFADLRGLSTVSRQMVRADRLMGLSPDYLGVLQRQLVRFFVWRDVARHEQVEAMVGRRIVSAIPASPKGDRLAVALTADDGSSITVELLAR